MDGAGRGEGWRGGALASGAYLLRVSVVAANAVELAFELERVRFELLPADQQRVSSIAGTHSRVKPCTERNAALRVRAGGERVRVRCACSC